MVNMEMAEEDLVDLIVWDFWGGNPFVTAGLRGRTGRRVPTSASGSPSEDRISGLRVYTTISGNLPRALRIP